MNIIKNLAKKWLFLLFTCNLFFGLAAVPISAAETIDINQADVKSLSTLHGIGKKKADAIVQYREIHGSFQTVDEIVNVKGIGKSILKKNHTRIIASQASTSQIDESIEKPDSDE